MKAEARKFIVGYFSYIAKIVPGVHVGPKDTEGFERDLDTRNKIYFRDVSIALKINFEASASIII